MNLRTVGSFADELKREHRRHRLLDFPSLIPARLRDMEVTKENFDEIVRKLNAIRDARIAEFRKLLGLNSSKNNLSKEKKRMRLELKLNYPYGALPLKQEKVRGEINFLYTLAKVVRYQ